MIQLEKRELDAVVDQVGRIPKRSQWECFRTTYDSDSQATVAAFTNASVPTLQKWFERAGGEVLRVEHQPGVDSMYITFRLSPTGESS